LQTANHPGSGPEEKWLDGIFLILIFLVFSSTGFEHFQATCAALFCASPAPDEVHSASVSDGQLKTHAAPRTKLPPAPSALSQLGGI
jgi:hypothetical protein